MALVINCLLTSWVMGGSSLRPRKDHACGEEIVVMASGSVPKGHEKEDVRSDG